MPLPRPPKGQEKLWALGALVIVVSTVIAVWWGLASTLGKPTWRNVAWHVDSPQVTQVTFEVNRPDGMAVTCRIEAQEVGHGVVGSLDVTLPAELGTQVVQTVSVRTTSAAVIGQVRTCRAAS